jgi:hypothetical protein
MRLGGGASLVDPFPKKPSHMHWRTYRRLRAKAMAADERSTALMVADFESAPSRSVAIVGRPRASLPQISPSALGKH